MKHYKVTNDDLRSVEHFDKVVSVQYVLGEWVRPHKRLEAVGMCLFVFNDLEKEIFLK